MESTTEPKIYGWWGGGASPGYGALVAGFKGHTRRPHHLALLAVTALDRAGFEIREKGDD